MMYAGIGSRNTPDAILSKMVDISISLARLGYLLRSGGADGADSAFEFGSDRARGKKEIWLPFPGYKGTQSRKPFYKYPTTNHIAQMLMYHPNGGKLRDVPKLLHARNMGQILGEDLKSPVDFVVCWTPDGCDSMLSYSRETGGTGTAICCASDHGIPIFNMKSLDFNSSFGNFIMERHANPS